MGCAGPQKRPVHPAAALPRPPRRGVEPVRRLVWGIGVRSLYAPEIESESSVPDLAPVPDAVLNAFAPEGMLSAMHPVSASSPALPLSV
jgi:hypothetical protein